MSELRINHTGIFTRNYDALLNPGVRFMVNQGGSRSSKTYSICQLLVWYSLTHAGKTVSVARKTGPALYASVYQDFMSILVELDLAKSVVHNKSNHIFTFPNGTRVRFFSVDNAQKLRGLKHDLVFLNEANELSFEEFTQINMRTSGSIILDWNPSDEYSWILDLQKDDKALLIHSTYLDNPFLHPEQIREIENLINIDDTYYQIYALGIIPAGIEKIFPKINYAKIPEGLDFRYGIDFGYNDPTAIVKVAQRDGDLYIEEIMYESFLTQEMLIDKMNLLKISKQHQIFADSARPDQIKSLQMAGFNVLKANKKIQEGLDYMKTLKLNLDPAGKDLVKEFRSYSYKKVKDRITDEPVDYMNHAIDAARYACISMKGNFSTAFFVV